MGLFAMVRFSGVLNLGTTQNVSISTASNFSTSPAVFGLTILLYTSYWMASPPASIRATLPNHREWQFTLFSKINRRIPFEWSLCGTNGEGEGMVLTSMDEATAGAWNEGVRGVKNVDAYQTWC
jgi:hypothetical protein